MQFQVGATYSMGPTRRLRFGAWAETSVGQRKRFRGCEIALDVPGDGILERREVLLQPAAQSRSTLLSVK